MNNSNERIAQQAYAAISNPLNDVISSHGVSKASFEEILTIVASKIKQMPSRLGFAEPRRGLTASPWGYT